LFYGYIIFVCLLLLIIIMLIMKLYQFSIIILSLEDAIEDCLDQLDEKYKSIGNILKQDVFFDSMEVRQVIAEITDSYNAILQIANRLTDSIRTPSETKKENIKKK
jgi:hypothetical protein